MRKEYEKAVSHLCAALKRRSLYPPNHPAILQPIKGAHDLFASLLTEKEEVSLGVIEDVLVFEDVPFYETMTTWQDLYQKMEEYQIETISFRRGLTRDELVEFIRLFSEKKSPENEGVLKEELDRFGIQHIKVKRLLDEKGVRESAAEVYNRALAVTFDLMTEIRMGKIPSSDKAREVVGEITDIVLRDKNAMICLAMLKRYDEYTFAHAVNVCTLSLAFGKHLGMEREALTDLGMAGLLHDVGKVRMDEEIIKKPGSLTREEIEMIRKHPTLGAEIISQMPGISPETQRIVKLHHIQYNRTGYPQLEQGEDIDQCCMMVTIADTYDTVTTLRPYRKPDHPAEAVKILRKLAGSGLHPELTEKFIEMIGVYPIASLVRLTTNELAVVKDVNHLDPLKPVVVILFDSVGRRVQETIEIDLAAPAPPGHERSIVCDVDPLTRGIDPAEFLQ